MNKSILKLCIFQYHSSVCSKLYSGRQHFKNLSLVLCYNLEMTEFRDKDTTNSVYLPLKGILYYIFYNIRQKRNFSKIQLRKIWR